jgi:hypothetical protein
VTSEFEIQKILLFQHIPLNLHDILPLNSRISYSKYVQCINSIDIINQHIKG